MIYQDTYSKGTLQVDTDRVADKFIRHNSIIVQPSTEEEESRMLDFMRKEGFAGEELGFPLSIDYSEKTYSCIGNGNCADPAAYKNVVVSEKAFYLLYSLYTVKR